MYLSVGERNKTLNVKPKRKGKVEIMEMTMRVEQMINDRGNAAANQFIIRDGCRLIFQSYDSIIAIVDYDTNEITLGMDWNYSKTTGKHRNIFFRDYAHIHDLETLEGVRKALKNGMCNGWTISESTKF